MGSSGQLDRTLMAPTGYERPPIASADGGDLGRSRLPGGRGGGRPDGRGGLRVRPVVRGPGPGGRHGWGGPRRHVGDDVRGVGAVRRDVGPEGRRGRSDRGPLGPHAERALPADRRDRRTLARGRPLVAAPARTSHGRRILGDRSRRQWAMEPARPAGGGDGNLDRMDPRNARRGGLRQRDRRSRAARSGRRLPGAVPRAARAPASESRTLDGGGGAPDRSPATSDRRAPRRGDRPRAHAFHTRGGPDRRRRGGLPDRSSEAAMSAVWIVVIVSGVGTLALKATGP